MKSLNNYISEKLVINKDYKQNDFLSPDKNGVCLEVGYACGRPDEWPFQVKRISLNTYKYELNDDVVSIIGNINPSDTRTYDKISEEGIYYYYKDPWLCILFFKDDAKEILKNAMSNNGAEFDFKNYVPSLNNKPTNFDNVYKIADYDNSTFKIKPYSFQKLHHMLTEIK